MRLVRRASIKLEQFPVEMSALFEAVVVKSSPHKPSIDEAAVPDEDAHSNVGSERSCLVTNCDVESLVMVPSSPARDRTESMIGRDVESPVMVSSSSARDITESVIGRDVESPIMVSLSPASVITESVTSRDAESPITVSSSPAAEVITQREMEEEGELEREGEAEEEAELRKRKELWSHMEQESKEERYRRLQFLLMKSNMYTEYLLLRMDRQKEEERKRRDRILKKIAKEKEQKKTEEEEEKNKLDEQKEKQDTDMTELSLSMDAEPPACTVVQSEKVVQSEPHSDADGTNTDSSQKSTDTQSCIRKTRSKLTLRAPVPKCQLSSENSPALSQSKSTPNTPGTNCAKTPLVESAKCETSHTSTPPTYIVIEETGSPTSDKENSPGVRHTRTSLKPPEIEDVASKRGRKRKVLDYNEQSPQGAKLLTHFFKPTSKRRKLEKDEEDDQSDENTNDKKVKKEAELFTGYPDIEPDGTIVRPALFTGGDLRRYQVEGLNWLKVLFENGVNGMLADEMGLGKTIQCVAMICQIVTMGALGPFMVVAPLSTLPNWKLEFKRFAPHLPVVFYHGSKDERAKAMKLIEKQHHIMDNVVIRPIVITSYEIAMRDRPVLKNFEWTYMIVDEGHRIKNKNCRLIRELKLYKNTHRLLLTGTPLQNNLSELWSLLNFLLPEIFDDLGSFETWFDVEMISDESADEAIIEEERKNNILGMLHQILTPFMLRRVKADVDLDIPPKKELLVYAPLSKVQLEFYEATVDKTILKKILAKQDPEEVAVDLDAKGRPKRGRKSGNKKSKAISNVNSVVTVRLNNIMMQLRKVCNHPYLLEYPLDAFGNYKMDEDLVHKCGKMMILDQMLPELISRGHKVLIFSQMTKMLDILEDYLCIRKVEYCRLDGSCAVDDRQESMERFNSDPNTSVFLLSTRAGGLGVNLIGADTVIIYDSDWNPQCDLQAQDRCHRIGQTKPVVVYRFVTANTIDQKIVERAAGKRKLEKMIIHRGKFKSGINKDFTSEVKPLCPEELMELLKSKDHSAIMGQGKQGEVISKEYLDALLDRSDMIEEFKEFQKKKVLEKR